MIDLHINISKDKLKEYLRERIKLTKDYIDQEPSFYERERARGKIEGYEEVLKVIE